MTEAIARLNQLDAGLERIEDRYTREFFSNLLAYMRSNVGDGLFTRGTVRGRDMNFGENEITSGGGILNAVGLNLADGGTFRTKVVNDVLPTATSKIETVLDNEMLGYVGWTESINPDGFGGVIWYPIADVSPADRVSSAGGTVNGVALTNASGSSLQYRMILFYRTVSDV